ncbi:hypothetical protein FSHL1_003277 [Fusarium sambucinum]
MAMFRLFAPTCFSFQESIPEVHAVTRLIIPRECRREITPPVLSLLLRKLPRLQTMVYEPWRSCYRFRKTGFDRMFAGSIQDALPSHVEMLSIFEDPNSKLVSAMHREHPLVHPNIFQQLIDDNMAACGELVRALVLRSCDLKHLSVSFMIDARQFLDYLQLTHYCHKLRSLSLTASVLKRESPSWRVDSFLRDASSFPHEMKQLERLMLWNSKQGEACAVIYQRNRSSQRATLTRRGTWHFELNRKVVECWENVNPDFILRIEHEQLQAVVKERGDAIYHLGLSGEVIDPNSARQLRQEELAETLAR